MPRSAEQLLRDIISVSSQVNEMMSGVSIAQYTETRSLQLAIERALEIVGGALRQLRDLDEELVARIDRYQSFIGLRHIIAHRYAVLEDEILWVTAKNALPQLSRQVESILADLVD
jgi:uncharacterized protein with HEPN domain